MSLQTRRAAGHVRLALAHGTLARRGVQTLGRGIERVAHVLQMGRVFAAGELGRIIGLDDGDLGGGVVRFRILLG